MRNKIVWAMRKVRIEGKMGSSLGRLGILGFDWRVIS